MGETVHVLCMKSNKVHQTCCFNRDVHNDVLIVLDVDSHSQICQSYNVGLPIIIDTAQD